MLQIPRDKNLDSTLALLRDGYEFIPKRCQRYQTDLFETRILFEKFICMRGAEAAKVFYDNDFFERRGVVPPRVQKTLFGERGVQGMDGEVHQHRKHVFMSLMTPERIQLLAQLSLEQWHTYSEKWEKAGKVTLFEKAQEILCRAVCQWAGVPLQESEVELRAKDFIAMVDGLAAIGPRHWRGRRARKRAERWIMGFIEKARAKHQDPAREDALHVISWHHDESGALLEKQVAAVEVINVLRPTVAVAWFVMFAAVALHEHREIQQKLESADNEYVEWFVQEVRRFYPFAPFVGARVRKEFGWKGYVFPKGRKVLLDLYGTDHDAWLWDKPEAFRPERFRQWERNLFDLIPQGGGDYYRNHRCPGEWITIELMKVAVRFLTTAIRYEVPAQDLRIDLSRIPAMPHSHFVIDNVRQSGVGRGGM